MNIPTELRQRPLGDSAMLAEADIPPLLKRLYVQRGVCAVGKLEQDAHRLLVYHPLTGIEQAVNLLVRSLADQQNNGSRRLRRGRRDQHSAYGAALRQMGAQTIDFMVPNHFEE